MPIPCMSASGRRTCRLKEWMDGIAFPKAILGLLSNYGAIMQGMLKMTRDELCDMDYSLWNIPICGPVKASRFG